MKNKLNTLEINNTQENVFKTTDFVLSVFLLYSEIELIRVETIPDDRNNNRKNFVFKKTEQLEFLLTHFIQSDPTVNIKKFTVIQKRVKKMIYNNKTIK